MTPGGSKSCVTCMHWQKPDAEDFSFIASVLGRCKQTPHLEGEGVKIWDDDNYDSFAPEYSNRTAFAVDASGYYAKLVTKAEHCCSMHETTEIS